MSLTYGTIIPTSIGARIRSVGPLSLDSSYPTGGYLIDAKRFGLFSIEEFSITGNGGGFIYWFNTVTGKLQIFDLSGGGLVITGTAAAQIWTAGAYTPAGTNSISSVTGTVGVTYLQVADTTPLPLQRLYTGAIGGFFPQVGATMSQAVSGASATVGAFNGIPPNSSIDTTGLVLGTFDNVNLVTGTNPDLSVFTFTPTMTALAVYAVSPVAAGFTLFSDQAGNMIFQVPENQIMAAGGGGTTKNIRYRLGPSQLEILGAEGVTTLIYEYTSGVANIAGAGTSAQTFTGTPAVLTGTNAPSAVTGVGVGAIAFGEVPGGTNLSAVTNLQAIAIGQA